MRAYCFTCMEAVEDGAAFCPCCGREIICEVPAHQLKPGTLLQGRYLIGKALGQGGFGITYIGKDTTLNMRVAIKEYYPNGYSNRNHDVTNNVTITASDQNSFFLNGKQKFLNEARTLAKFCGEPGIVGVRDFFEANNTAYIVMEYLDGITLKDYIIENGPFSSSTLFPVMRPIVNALEKVHKQSVIHRDISPDNIIVLQDGAIKLLDFGAAREVGGDKSLSVMLKPGYAPEEQYRSSGRQGPWTDVYALCATLYFCLTGRRPEESIERIWNDNTPLPSSCGADVSHEQEAVIMKGLSVKAEDRYQSIQELSNALYDMREQTLQHGYEIHHESNQRFQSDELPKENATIIEEQRIKDVNILNDREEPETVLNIEESGGMEKKEKGRKEMGKAQEDPNAFSCRSDDLNPPPSIHPTPWLWAAVFAVVAVAIAVIVIIVTSPPPEHASTRYTITLTAVSDEKVYDGNPLITYIRATPLADHNHSVSADYVVYDSNGNLIQGDPIDIGKYIKKVCNVHIYSGKNDITDQYDITTINGTLTILAPTPELELIPTPTLAPTPSAADLDTINADIIYPHNAEMYLPFYKSAKVCPSPGKTAVYAFKDPDNKNDPMRSGNYYTVSRDTEVTVLAESLGYSCVIINDSQKAGWINSKYLVEIS